MNSSSLTFWDVLAEIAVAFVILGVIGEEAKKIGVFFAKSRRKTLSEERLRMLEVVESSFWIILIVGLSVEFLAHHRGDGIRKSQIVKLEIESDKSNKLASEANERTASIEFARVQLEKQVEELRSTNLVLQCNLLELEAKIQPRSLNAGKRAKVLQCLKAAEKGKVLVSCDWFDSEAYWCAREILDVLKQSDFAADAWSFNGQSATLALRDVGITIIVQDASHVPIYISGIAGCFAEVGLPMKIKTPDSGSLTVDSNSAIIWVGRKP